MTCKAHLRTNNIEKRGEGQIILAARFSIEAGTLERKQRPKYFERLQERCFAYCMYVHFAAMCEAQVRAPVEARMVA